MKMDVSKVKTISVKFRGAIELCSQELGIAFSRFPNGSCGDTKNLLGTFLIENNLGEFNYIIGTNVNHTPGTHAWLQQGDLVVDITADQFINVRDKVIVSSSSGWHRSIEAKIMHVADYRVEESTFANYDEIYKKILEFI